MVYKHKCSICKSPSANVICSNSKCKSWHKYRRLAAEYKTIEKGLTLHDPIVIYCKCKQRATPINKDRVYCFICHYGFNYNYIINRWYADGSKMGAIKYVGEPIYWYHKYD